MPLAAGHFNIPMIQRDFFKDILFGVSVGDALGVPVEFKDRKTLLQNPVVDFIGYGTYNLPPGTWSDDSSLTFCLAEALKDKFDLNQIGQNFVKWLYESYWTPYGNVFDVGNTTRIAINNLRKGINPEIAGGFYEDENGNGSLMRILPLLLHIKNKEIADRYHITKQVSSITHGHIRSVIACFYYLEFAKLIIEGKSKFDAYDEAQKIIKKFLIEKEINPKEIELFNRLLQQNISKEKEISIHSSGYVIHTLEASIWCLLTTDSYKEATLKAVNLGYDTDTTAAVTGGLAALLYGHDTIPKNWISQLARKDDIDNLAFQCKFSNTGL